MGATDAGIPMETVPLGAPPPEASGEETLPPAEHEPWSFVPEATPLKSASDLPPAMEFEAPRTVIFSSAPGAGAAQEPTGAVPVFQPTAFEPPPPEAAFQEAMPPLQTAGFPPPGAGGPVEIPAFDPSMQTPTPFEQPRTVLFGGEGGQGFDATPEGVVIPGFGMGQQGQAEAAEIFPSGGATGSIPLTGPYPGQPEMPSNLWSSQSPVTEIPQARPMDDLFATRPTPIPTAIRPTGEQTASTQPKSKKKQSKWFLIGLGISAGVMIVASFFFLRNPKDAVMLISMSPQKKEAPAGAPAAPAGAQPVQSAPAPQAAPQAQPQAAQAPRSPFPTHEQPAPDPQAPVQPAKKAPAAGRDYISNENIQAIEFVKNHYLDKEHGTIAQWLQYSFASQDATPSWDAGAVSASVYIVTYKVSRAGKVKAAYNFEADLAKKTLIGRNPEALSLLNAGKPAQGPGPAPKAVAPFGDVVPKAAAAPERAGKPARAARAPRPKPTRTKAAAPEAPPKEEEQIPLPDEEELESSGRQAGSRFNNPGADQVDISP
jgi:hypothetical protein